MNNENNVQTSTTNTEIIYKKPNKAIKILKNVFSVIWLIISCIFYLIGTIFLINFLLDLFDSKKK